jgi:sec-independent protein translocase protein TatB
MLSLSPIKILIVLVVAMILLGPDKLPQVARQLGAGWRAFREFQQKMEHEVRSTIPDLPSTEHIAKMARSPISFLNSLADMPANDLEPPVADPGATEELAADDAPWPSDPSATQFATTEMTPPPAGPPPAAPPRAPSSPSGLRSVAAGSPEPFPVPDDPSMN